MNAYCSGEPPAADRSVARRTPRKGRVGRCVIYKQLLVLAGAAAGCLAVLLVAQHAAQLFARLLLPADDAARRLAYASDWLLLPAVTLLAGLASVCTRRRFSADAIEGTRTPASRSLEINLRYNQHTLEQTLLAAIA